MHQIIEIITRKNPSIQGYEEVVIRGRGNTDRRLEGGLTASRLRSLLLYDPDTGVFTWRVDRVRVRAGQRAGKLTKEGYIHIGVDGRRYQAHRLAFLYMTGSIPVEYVDHRNLDRSDNRWKNLRAATNSQNQMNTSIKASNTSGYKCVSWHKGERRWRADIRIGGRKTFIGYFDTPVEANEAYLTHAEKHHGEFSRAI